MRLICIKNTKSTNDGVTQKYFKVGEQYDAQEDYKIDDQYFVIYHNDYNYTVKRRYFTTVENWRDKQLKQLGI